MQAPSFESQMAVGAAQVGDPAARQSKTQVLLFGSQTCPPVHSELARQVTHWPCVTLPERVSQCCPFEQFASLKQPPVPELPVVLPAPDVVPEAVPPEVVPVVVPEPLVVEAPEVVAPTVVAPPEVVALVPTVVPAVPEVVTEPVVPIDPEIVPVAVVPAEVLVVPTVVVEVVPADVPLPEAAAVVAPGPVACTCPTRQ